MAVSLSSLSSRYKAALLSIFFSEALFLPLFLGYSPSVFVLFIPGTGTELSSLISLSLDLMSG
jgi:hypothetical protein